MTCFVQWYHCIGLPNFLLFTSTYVPHNIIAVNIMLHSRAEFIYSQSTNYWCSTIKTIIQRSLFLSTTSIPTFGMFGKVTISVQVKWKFISEDFFLNVHTNERNHGRCFQNLFKLVAEINELTPLWLVQQMINDKILTNGHVG